MVSNKWKLGIFSELVYQKNPQHIENHLCVPHLWVPLDSFMRTEFPNLAFLLVSRAAGP